MKETFLQSLETTKVTLLQQEESTKVVLLQQEESSKGSRQNEWSMKEVEITETFQGLKLFLCLTKKTKKIKQRMMLRKMKLSY